MKQHLRKIGHYLLSAAALMYISLSVLKGLLYQLEEDNLNVERRASVQSHVVMPPSGEHLQNALKSDSRDGRDWIYQKSNEKIETGDNNQSNKSHSISGGHRKLFIKDMDICGNSQVTRKYFTFVRCNFISTHHRKPTIHVQRKWRCTQRYLSAGNGSFPPSPQRETTRNQRNLGQNCT